MLKKSSHNLIFFLFLVGGVIFFYQKSTANNAFVAKKSTPLPPIAFQHQLDSLKETDSLEAWLNAWYVYLSDQPSTHYNEFTIPLHSIWRKPKNASEDIAWFYLHILIGYYELQQGNILKSTSVYEKAYQFVQQTSSIHPNEILEYLIKPLGNNYTRLGDYERAFFIQQQGLKLAQSLEDPMQEASMLANISTTARWNNQLDRALKFANEGLKKVHSNTALQALLYSTKADILQSQSKLNKAKTAILKGIHLFNKLPLSQQTNNAYWYTGTLVTAGEIEKKSKNYNEALSYFHKALTELKYYFPHSKQREKLKIQVALGQINTTQEKSSKGLQHFNNALVGLIPKFQKTNYWPKNKSLYPENTLLDALTGKAKLLALQGKDSIALIGYQKATTVIDKLRKTIFSKEAKRLLQKQSLKTTEEAISLAFKLYQKSKYPFYANIAFKSAEQHKARLLLNDLQKGLSHSHANQNDSLFIKQKRLKQAIAFYTHSYIQATLQQQSRDSSKWKHQIDQTQYQLSLIHKKIKNRYPNLNWDTSIRLKALFKNIPVHTIFREYFTGLDHWYAFSVSQKGVVSFSKLGNSRELTAEVSHFINHWFSHGSGAMINHPKAYFQKANQLYQKLSFKLPSNISKLTIIPDGILGRLPFEALITDAMYLPNPGKWPYLLLKAQTSQAYSLSVWNHLQNAYNEYNKQSGFTGFFISPQKDNSLAELKGVQNEIASVEKVLSGEFFVNKKANTKRLFKSIKNKEVIHISTHSFLMKENKIPALQMSNQKVLLADLYPIDAHPSLIVISACQTANGLLSPGEGIISLARQFTAIGSGGVISALWSINDITAAKLTALFYQNLQKSNKKAFALYHAKNQWLNTPSRSAVHKLPYYWAGLVYYGNHLSLSNPLKTPIHFQYWLWILGIVLILAFLLFLLKKRKRNTHNKHERIDFP